MRVLTSAVPATGRFQPALDAADQAALRLRASAAERDRANQAPRAEAELLRENDPLQVQEPAEYGGDFCRIRDFSLKPRPLSCPGRPHPEIFQAGNSSAARRNGGQLPDWYFSNGKDFDGVREQLAELRQVAGAAGRTHGPRSGLNGSVIADSAFENPVQYNDGFRTQLIGTPEQVATRIFEYRKPGVDLILTGFLHYHEEIRRFGRDVLPIVRELEVAAGLDRGAVPGPLAGLTAGEATLSAAR